MKLSDLTDFNNLLNQIKNLILICVRENKLVDAEYSKKIFKLIFSSTKKYHSNLQRSINV